MPDGAFLLLNTRPLCSEFFINFNRSWSCSRGRCKYKYVVKDGDDGR